MTEIMNTSQTANMNRAEKGVAFGLLHAAKQVADFLYRARTGSWLGRDQV